MVPAGLALVLYVLTATPTINFGDSGELTTVAWTVGIAYPPGYPLYTLISSAFIHLLPFGEPAWRLNILSALFAALVVGLFYGLVVDTLTEMPAFVRAVLARHSTTAIFGAGSAPPAAPPPTRTRSTLPAKSSATRRPAAISSGAAGRAAKPPDEAPGAPLPATELAWAAAAGGLAAAGLLAVSVTFWNWATQAKMYSLHFTFMVGLFWLALRARRAIYATDPAGVATAPRWPPTGWPRGIRLLHLLMLLAGLALTNHYLTFLLLPGIAALVLIPPRRGLIPWRGLVRYVPSLLAAGLLPLLLYLYLPIRAGTHPLLDWGTPDNWSDLWLHLTVGQFRGYMGTSGQGFVANVGSGLVFAANQFGLRYSLLLLLPILAGFIYLWRTDRALLAATSGTILINLLYAWNYNIREIGAYYIPVYVLLLWWAGLGLAWVLGLFLHEWRASHSLRPQALIVRTCGLVIPLIGLVINWGAAGHQDDHTGELYTRNAFANYRPNAVVLTDDWDLVSGTYYLQDVLNERRDVALIDTRELYFPYYLDYLEQAYPAVIQKIAAQYVQYKAAVRHGVDVGAPPPDFSQSYSNLLNSLVDTNLGQRPVYATFDQLPPEILGLLNRYQDRRVPDGFGYRIAADAADRAPSDPQFDLRGVDNPALRLDEIAASGVSVYPDTLQRLSDYLAGAATTAAQRQMAQELAAEATQLQPLNAGADARPGLR